MEYIDNPNGNKHIPNLGTYNAYNSKKISLINISAFFSRKSVVNFHLYQNRRRTPNCQKLIIFLSEELFMETLVPCKIATKVVGLNDQMRPKRQARWY